MPGHRGFEFGGIDVGSSHPLWRCRFADGADLFLSDKLSDPHYNSDANIRIKPEVLRRNGPNPMAALAMLLPSKPPQGTDKFATILLQEATHLNAMDRYGRRALSRRKFAIRALDAERSRRLTLGI